MAMQVIKYLTFQGQKTGKVNFLISSQSKVPEARFHEILHVKQAKLIFDRLSSMSR